LNCWNGTETGDWPVHCMVPPCADRTDDFDSLNSVFSRQEWYLPTLAYGFLRILFRDVWAGTRNIPVATRLDFCKSSISPAKATIPVFYL